MSDLPKPRTSYRMTLLFSENSWNCVSHIRLSKNPACIKKTLIAIEPVSLSKTSPRTSTKPFSDLTLTCRPGKIFTPPGHNGAGKTPFLKSPATQPMPTKGEISVLGHDAKNEPLEIR